MFHWTVNLDIFQGQLRLYKERVRGLFVRRAPKVSPSVKFNLDFWFRLGISSL